MNQRRMAVYSKSGVFVRQYFVPSDSGSRASPFRTLACSSRGTLSYQSQPMPPKVRTPPKNPRMPTREERVLNTTAAVTLSNTNGKVTRSLNDRSSGAMYIMGGGAFPLPLATTTYVAIAGDKVFVGTADSTSSVDVFSADGKESKLQISVPRRATTAAHKERAAIAMASVAPASVRTMAADSLKLSPMPAMLPPYSGLFGDADGVLWVQLTVLGDPNTRLRAIGANMATLGEIMLPANVTVHEIGRDYVLAAFDDNGDVPHFVMYRLHRGR